MTQSMAFVHQSGRATSVEPTTWRKQLSQAWSMSTATMLAIWPLSLVDTSNQAIPKILALSQCLDTHKANRFGITSG